MIASLDASAIIYLVEARKPFQQIVERQLADASGKDRLPIAISSLSWLECRIRPLRDRNREVLADYESFFGFPDLSWVDLTRDVVNLATAIRARHGLQTADALQAACALQLGPDHVFLAGDRAFERVEGLNAKRVA